MYVDRYADLASKSLVIPNGYDEENFPNQIVARERGKDAPLTIVHSGLMNPVGRNPLVFLEALRILKQDDNFNPGAIKIIFRACGFEKDYKAAAAKLGVADLVTFAEYLPYEQAIREMVTADGLMLFQGSVFNHAVPAKFYEYLYARTPIFALIDKDGETAVVLQKLGITSTANIDSVEDTVAKFRHYIRSIKSGAYKLPAASLIEQFSRRRQVERLSEILEEEAGI